MVFLKLNRFPNPNQTMVFFLAVVVCLGSLLSSTKGESDVNSNIPDLKREELDNMFDTVQLHGIWIFYENYAYNSDKPGAVQVIFEPSECSTQLREDLAWKVSSVRHVGSTSYYHYNGSTLTLYSDSSFQGGQIVIEADIPYVSIRGNGDGDGTAHVGFGSIILAGNASWTLYSSPNFQGDAVCVHPQGRKHNDRPTLIYETDEIAELARKSIQSVRIGCYGNSTATIPVVPVLETRMSQNPPSCDSASWSPPSIPLCECL